MDNRQLIIINSPLSVQFSIKNCLTMKESILKNRLGRFILITNIGFAFLIVIYYLLKGFTNSEFAQLLKILVPIKAVYLTALIRYLIVNRNIQNDKKDTKQATLLFANSSFLIIFGHITILVIITSIYALFNAIDFEVLMNIIIVLETLFGIYIGVFIASTFQINNKQP